MLAGRPMHQKARIEVSKPRNGCARRLSERRGAYALKDPAASRERDRTIQIRNQVVRMLQSDGQPHVAGRHASRQLVLER